MDWTKYTTDPCNADIRIRIKKHLRQIRRIETMKYLDWLLAKVENKTCLDIGAIEHDLSYTERSTWKHKLLVERAKKVVGVDILEDFARKLNERGYDIRTCDATSDEYLGEVFDVVVLGDILEHVANPIDLIRFAIRHLHPDGETIVTTPNPYYIDNIKTFIKNNAITNFEHIAWFTPSMALEIARRAGCELMSYVVFPRKRPWPKIFPQSDLFTRDYVFIFKSKTHTGKQ